MSRSFIVIPILALLASSVTLGAILCVPCAADAPPVRVLCLRGPTGMGLVKLMEDAGRNGMEGRYTFQVVPSPDNLAAAFARGDADIFAMPANMAAILWNRTGGGLQVLSVNTLGVLALVERGNAIHSLRDLGGRIIAASGRGAAPEHALNYLLKKEGVTCRVDWKSEHAEVIAALAAGKADVGLLPHPFIETAMDKVDGLREALSLTEEWRRLGDGSELVMGVNAARRGWIESHPAEAAAFLRGARASVEFVNAHPGEAAALMVKHRILDDAGVAERAIPNCNLVALTGAAMERALSGYLGALADAGAKTVGGRLPDRSFYHHDE